MPWFKVDDKAHEHRKFRGCSLPAVGLWTLAGAWSSDLRMDGFVPDTVLRRWGASEKHAGELVARGLWVQADKDGESGWRFHDWADWQPERKDVETALGRARWTRNNNLKKNRALCDQIVARDGGLCRYCGVRVKWTDRRSPIGATYDHVDPDGDNTLENIVVACRRCNGRKKDRTPEEAGMPLVEPGQNRIGSRSDLDPTQQEPAASSQDGASRVDTRSDRDGHQVGSSSEHQVGGD